MQSMRRYYEDTMKRYMSDLQGRQRSPSPDPPPPPTTPSRREGQALDLTASPPIAPPVPALDLSKDGGDEMPGSSEPFDRSEDDDKSENNLDGRDAIQACRNLQVPPQDVFNNFTVNLAKISYAMHTRYKNQLLC